MVVYGSLPNDSLLDDSLLDDSLLDDSLPNELGGAKSLGRNMPYVFNNKLFKTFLQSSFESFVSNVFIFTQTLLDFHW